MAWKPDLNTSEKWVVLAEPQELATFDCFLVVGIPPFEGQKFGRLVCQERYSRLLALHRLCTGQHPQETPRRFPQKKMFRNRAADFLQQRASALADYFEEAFAVPECLAFYLRCDEFHVVQGDLRDPVFASMEREYPSIVGGSHQHEMPIVVSDLGDISEEPEDEIDADADADADTADDSVGRTRSRPKHGSVSGIQLAPLDTQAFLSCSLENECVYIPPTPLTAQVPSRLLNPTNAPIVSVQPSVVVPKVADWTREEPIPKSHATVGHASRAAGRGRGSAWGWWRADQSSGF
jgi:hypothetical protein